jgi:hypothetical protein
MFHGTHYFMAKSKYKYLTTISFPKYQSGYRIQLDENRKYQQPIVLNVDFVPLIGTFCENPTNRSQPGMSR